MNRNIDSRQQINLQNPYTLLFLVSDFKSWQKLTFSTEDSCGKKRTMNYEAGVSELKQSKSANPRVSAIATFAVRSAVLRSAEILCSYYFFCVLSDHCLNTKLFREGQVHRIFGKFYHCYLSCVSQ